MLQITPEQLATLKDWFLPVIQPGSCQRVTSVDMTYVILRKQARTPVGPMVPQRHYAIRFTRREEFESAWPQILKVKSKGAPVFLVRGPNFFLPEGSKAGVVVHAPPPGQAENPLTPEAPIHGVTHPRERWMNTTYIELVVDGEIVDLNRIRLPTNTPTIDERFKKGPKR